MARPSPLFAMMTALAGAALPLGGCNVGPMLTISGSVTAGSLIVTGKTPEDHLAGWLTGMDCSSVRFEQRRPWCIPHGEPPGPPPFCTRSIGSIDCWTAPPAGAPLRGVADPGPFPEPPPGLPGRPWGSPG